MNLNPLLLLLLLSTWVTSIYHLATFPNPSIETPEVNPENVVWIPKSQAGIHQLILKGSPYERGYLAGEKTASLLLAEEETLQKEIERIIPNGLFRRIFYLGLMRYFWGAEKHFEPWMIDEMRGIAAHSSRQFDFLADPLTRQVAYHGLHEVGQTMVDLQPGPMGCTVFGFPFRKSWLIGRNFDFEAGRIFDEEKILKWVFPTEGNSFVSVIWAGMVGGVTGVNEHGIYISINAAGSTDYRRLGMPSTLVWLKALQFSKSGDDAAKIIEEANMFITDIFVVVDRTSGKAYRIEKSPLKTHVLPLEGPSVVTNHLLHPDWKNDRINIYRRTKATSEIREKRGRELISTWKGSENPQIAASQLLAFLRDKEFPGDRRSIDSGIATHSVIFNGRDNILYVSRGPALRGEFQGYDLTESFRRKFPVRIDSLPAEVK